MKNNLNKILTNWNRYIVGGMIGMIAEYLYRVDVNIYAIICLVSLVIFMIFDLLTIKQ